jgi:arsenate reductase
MRAVENQTQGETKMKRFHVHVAVCDQAAGEMCPVWPGHPITAHWSFEDPAAFQGTDGEKRERFKQVYRQIMTRMRMLVSLPLASLDRLAGEQKVRAIGQVKP